jgi:hypothetical protein
MKLLLKILTVSFLLTACKPDEPTAKYQYEANPIYSWGYAEFYGPYYTDYNNKNNVISLSLFTDSLAVIDGNLSGLGQYLYIEDIFVSANDTILPEGKYVSSASGEAFTFYPGEQFPVDEFKIDVGSFLYYIEKNKNFTVQRHVSRGSFTVKRTDLKHTINCDFVLSDSSKITGSFTDTVPHFDFSSHPAGVRRHKIKFTL